MPIVLAYVEPPAVVARFQPGMRVSVITNPDWLRRPTGEEMMALYPQAAAGNGVEGRALIRCTVNARGTLVDCYVMSEDPPGAGFGAAALAMTPSFLMRPMTKDGSPVDGGKIQIPIAFRLPQPPTTPPPVEPALPANSLNPAEVIIKKPRPADYARYFPVKPMERGLEGRAVIQCLVDDKGHLVQCAVVAEAPLNENFGAAAVKISRLFGVSAKAPDGSPTAGRPVRIGIRWTLPHS